MVQPAKKLNIPAGAKTVDGTGKFLVPGLVDAHIHFFQNGGLYTRPDAIDLRKFFPYEKEMELAHHDMEEKLRSYLRAGITTVMDVGSSSATVQTRWIRFDPPRHVPGSRRHSPQPAVQ